METIYYIILIMNAILVVVNKRSKILATASYIYTIILFAGSTLNNDYHGYLEPYMERDFSEFEIGYRIVANVFAQNNIHYHIFLLFIAIVCYTLIFYLFIKTVDNVHIFFALYYPILVFYDINQIRNFIMATLMTFAIVKLLENRRAVFLLCLFIAASFQSLALAYIPLVFINDRRFQNKKVIISIVLFSFAFSLVAFFNNKQIPFLYEICTELFGKNSEKLMYFESKDINFGFLITYIMQMINILLVVVSYRNLKKCDVSINVQQFAKKILIINVYGFITFPFLMIDLTFYRLFRNFSFINYILFGLTIDNYYLRKHEHSLRPIRKTGEDLDNGTLYARERVGWKRKKYISFLIYIVLLIIFCMVWKYGIIYKYRGPLQSEYILNNNIFYDWLSNKY